MKSFTFDDLTKLRRKENFESWLIATTPKKSKNLSIRQRWNDSCISLFTSLYTQPEVAIRELISNASDALHKIRFRQLTDKNILNPEAPLRIDIAVDSNAQTFSITDTGIGMTKDDLTERIGTVASSGTLEFLEQMKEGDKPFDANLIGQFGIGFYSVFMLTERNHN